MLVLFCFQKKLGFRYVRSIINLALKHIAERFTLKTLSHYASYYTVDKKRETQDYRILAGFAGFARQGPHQQC